MSQPTKAERAGPREGLSRITSEWLDLGDPQARKARGQYMTPRPVAEALVDRIGLRPGMTVLDPGVGTGELLRAVLDREPGLEAFGWDIDESALEAAARLVPEALLELRSALDRAPAETARGAGPAPGGAGTETTGRDRFDLVIGNPPYFQLRLSPADRRRFEGVISGRANIFALFFQVGLENLRPGGTLAYIVPPSMNSGAYFEALREYITGRATIEDLTILEGTGIFEGANTAVQLLVLRKRETAPRAGSPPKPKPSPGVGRGEFTFRREVPEAGFRRVLFSVDPDRLAVEFEGRTTLWELGLEAVTGQVIWNENRDRLAGRPGTGRVPLVWSHNIGEGVLRAGKSTVTGPGGEAWSRPGKPGFYDTREGGRAPLKGPAIVVNRVVGAVGRGELRAALIPAGAEFLAENHVNVIRCRQVPAGSGSDFRPGCGLSDPPRGEAGSGAGWVEVLAALRQPGVAERVRLLTGNTQISARELTHLLPLALPG